MTDAAAFRATFHKAHIPFRGKVVQLTFEVPIEHRHIVLEALGGLPDPANPTWCAIARLKNEAS